MKNSKECRNCNFCCKRFYKDKVLHCSLTNEEKSDSDICESYEADEVKIKNSKRTEGEGIDVSEKKKPTIWEIVGIIATALFYLLFFYLVGPSFSTTISIGNNFLILVLIGISLTLAVVLFLMTRKISVKRFEKKIIRYFKEEGYACEKQDGTLYAKVKGHTYSIYLWDMKNPRIKRFYLVYDFIPDKLEDVSAGGVCSLVAFTNVANSHTTTMVYNHDFIRCRFESAISNIKDFDTEFRVACNHISDAVNCFYDNYDFTREKFPAENVRPTRVGFNVDVPDETLTEIR